MQCRDPQFGRLYEYKYQIKNRREKYQNKYLIKTNRLQNWDYGQDEIIIDKIDDRHNDECNGEHNIETSNLGVSTFS